MPTHQTEIWYLVIGITILLLFFTVILITITLIGQKRKMLNKQQLSEEKIKLQQSLLEQKDAILAERNRITADLHDDIGATLSSMHIYSDLAANVWHTQPHESKKIVETISTTAKALMDRMGDIVWSMKSAEEEKNNFTVRLKNYCNELLSPKNILFVLEIDENLTVKIKNPEIRKNILLIAKEAINNIAKYSLATQAVIKLVEQNEKIVLSITDNGIGFDASTVKQGNGLQNIHQRCKQLKGICIIQSALTEGTTITCSLPIAIISHT